MRTADLVRLSILAAIWGASFLFMRILAPVLGALWTAEMRVAIAAIAMLAWMAALRQPMQFRLHWKNTSCSAYSIPRCRSHCFPMRR